MIGQTISHYRVTARLGAGGMGEVYRATDTKLGRDVALKVLPEAFAKDDQRMARFEREAQVLASLNHPNIATIHGLEESGTTRALVMELVEGSTLAERLAQGAIPLEEALPIARQIAEALEYAHEHGIIHRDLKPANIKLSKDGPVKVLDFGLAKALSDDVSAQDLSNSPTISMAATRAGIILGTAAYMSPEQARGTAVDRRADIWAFGIVFFEMLTGRQAFTGETASDTLAAVLRAEINWSALPAATPPAIRGLLRRCLDRDRKHRLQSIGDARVEIEEALAAPAAATQAAQAIRGFRTFPWRVALGAAALMFVLSWTVLRMFSGGSPSSTGPPLRLSVTIPSETPLDFQDRIGVAISPDGSKLVYVASKSGSEPRLYVRPMDRFEATVLPGTDGVSSPFFSPDGQWLGFFAGGKLKKISVTGGVPVVLADAPDDRGGVWAPDGNVFYSPSASSGIWRISADGGNSEAVTSPDSKNGENSHRWPALLPDAKTLLFTVKTATTPTFDDARIVAFSLPTGEKRTLLEGAGMARYAPGGFLAYSRAGELYAAPFDSRTLRLTGPAIRIAQDVSTEPGTGAGNYAFSASGTLAYVSGGVAFAEKNLVWVDRSGKVQPVPLTPRLFIQPRMSPDGRSVVVGIGAANNSAWVYDLARGALTRLTFETDNVFSPVWTADGQRVIYSSATNILWRPADGSAPAERLTSSPNPQSPLTVSPDGKWLAYEEYASKSRFDIWILPLTADGKPFPFVHSDFDEVGAAFSADARWLAYVSNESGRNEVYALPFPGPGGKIQISTEGGHSPVWSRDGKELFYHEGNRLMRVPVDFRQGLRPGKPEVLFEGRFVDDPLTRNYDISPDGRRFLMVQDASKPSDRSQIHVVMNWVEEISRTPARK